MRWTVQTASYHISLDVEMGFMRMTSGAVGSKVKQSKVTFGLMAAVLSTLNADDDQVRPQYWCCLEKLVLFFFLVGR